MEPSPAVTDSEGSVLGAPQAHTLVSRQQTLPALRQPHRHSATLVLLIVAATGALAAGSWWYFGAAVNGEQAESVVTAQAPDAGTDRRPVDAKVATPKTGAENDIALDTAANSQISESEPAKIELTASPATNPRTVTGRGVSAAVGVASTQAHAEHAESQAPGQGGPAGEAAVNRVASDLPVASADVGSLAATSLDSAAQAELPVAPQAPPWDPAHPQVLVAGFGDPAIAAPLEVYLERQLSQAGYALVDEDYLAAAALFSGPRPQHPMRLAAAALTGGADVAILFEVLPIGEQELKFYGRRAALRTAAVQLRMVSLHQRRPLGAAIRDNVRYVPLNASNKAERVGSRIAPKVLHRLAMAAKAG